MISIKAVKRISAVFVAVAVFASAAGLAAQTSAKRAYNSIKAIAYAEEHWNGPKGRCAEFVSDCLNSGYVMASDVKCTPLIKQLKSYGEVYKLEPTGRYLRLDNNNGHIEVGDPIFWYCGECGRYKHVALCNGASADGNIVNYAHNDPKDGTVEITTGNCYTCNNPYESVWAVHISGQSIQPPKSVTTEKSVYEPNDTVTVRWEKSEGAVSYNVVVWKDKQFLCNKNVGDTDTYQISGVGRYDVYVWANDGKRYATTRTPCRFYIGEVGDAAVGVKSYYFFNDQPIALQWSQAEKASGYSLKVTQGENVVLQKSFGSSTTDHSLGSLAAGVYKVELEAVSGSQDYRSSLSSCEFEVAAFAKPSVSGSYDKTTEKTTLKWNSASEKATYDVKVCDSSGETYKSYTALTGLSCTEKFPVGKYTVKVTAVSTLTSEMKLSSDEYTFEVYPKAKKISIENGKSTVRKDNTYQLSLNTEPQNTSSIFKWTSSNTKVAKVDGNGVVNGVGIGTSVITVTTGKLKATCKVEVVQNFDMTILGSTVSVNEPYCMRFGVQLNKDNVYKKTKAAEYGVLIISEDELGGVELLLDTPGVVQLKSKKKLSDDEAQLTYVSEFADISLSSVKTRYAARGYLLYKDAGGKKHVVYTDVISRSFYETAYAARCEYSAAPQPSEDQRQAAELLKKLLISCGDRQNVG